MFENLYKNPTFNCTVKALKNKKVRGLRNERIYKFRLREDTEVSLTEMKVIQVRVVESRSYVTLRTCVALRPQRERETAVCLCSTQC